MNADGCRISKQMNKIEISRWESNELSRRRVFAMKKSFDANQVKMVPKI